MKTLLNVLQWIWAVFLGLMSIVFFKENGIALIGGIILILCAIFVAPILSDRIFFKKDKPIKNIFKRFGISLLVMLFSIVLFYPSKNEKSNSSETDSSSSSIDDRDSKSDSTISEKLEEDFTETTSLSTSASTTLTTEETTTATTTTTSNTTTTTTSATTTSATTTTTTTTPPTTTTTTTTTTTPPATTSSSSAMIHFVLNKDTYCVHLNPNCRAAENIKAENYAEIDIKEDEIYLYGNQYWACGICCRKYEELLPKE